MPESSGSGQCDPVTGDALQSTSTPAMPMRMISPSSTSTTFDNTLFLPLSPPSTPSTSPREGCSSLSWSSRGARASLEQEASSHDDAKLRQALASIDTTDPIDLLTPDSTPLTMSPAELMVRHQPQVSARDFVTSILPRVGAIGHGGRRYLIEDAGMELVCPGWGGAVIIDTKAATMMGSSSAPQISRSVPTSSMSSTRMSRASSSSSTTASSPRRTLMTMMAALHADTRDLRSSILDALDHATEKLQVENVIFVLDRTGLDEEKFRVIVHGLCYVGANIIGHGRSEQGDGEGTNASQNQDSDVEEDLHSPRLVAPNLVLLSVDV